ERWIAEHAPGLLDGVQLVRGGAARLDVTQLRHAVERDAPREARALLPAAVEEIDRLLGEPGHGAPAGARHPRIGGYDDAAQPHCGRERPQDDVEPDAAAARPPHHPAPP